MEHVESGASVLERTAAGVIRKRDGRTEPYEPGKIIEAMRLSLIHI